MSKKVCEGNQERVRMCESLRGPEGATSGSSQMLF